MSVPINSIIQGLKGNRHATLASKGINSNYIMLPPESFQAISGGLLSQHKVFWQASTARINSLITVRTTISLNGSILFSSLHYSYLKNLETKNLK